MTLCDEFQFQSEPWDADFAGRDYRDSLRRGFEKAIADYELKSRRAAEVKNLIRAPAKYSLVNFEWFALYQFAGMSSKEIADWEIARGRSNAADESTILKDPTCRAA